MVQFGEDGKDLIPADNALQIVRRFRGVGELRGNTIVSITDHELLARVRPAPKGYLLEPTKRGRMILDGAAL